MLQEDRLFQIMKYLKSKGSASLEELTQLTNVSAGTVRRDLSKLQDNGMLSIVRGGAIYRNYDSARQNFDMRSIESKDEKRALTQFLTEIISDGQAIALNSGTTNMEVAQFLVRHYRRLTILTNNLKILNILKAGDHFTLILPGGILDTNEHAVIGSQCEAEIMTYNLDIALLAVNALSTQKGVTDFRLPEVGIAQAMLKAAKTKVVVADHTKFDRISCMNICALSEIDYILTDEKLTQEQAEQYRAHGVRIFLPQEEGRDQ